MVQLTCPDASRWEALLADSATPDDATELEAHLSSCSRCRTVLDDLAVGSSGWLRDAGRLAGVTGQDPALTRTLHRLHDSAVEDDHTVPPIPLDFLSPSEQPGILGTLGRYQILAVLGRGAFGIVLKALDPDLLRPVAIKVLAPYLASSGTARQRFIREGRAAAAVSHDHVVKIHGIEPASLPYLVMEYVTGVSLQSRLDRDGPLPPRDIARIGLQAARGLEAAHAQGLVHRDIKPSNILLENGVERVKLTDFGLARAADDARLTQSGVAAGTPLYMSPEQARGETVDHRSDLFSLGSVLYALATGFPPFRAGSTMGVLNRITNDAPRPIRETIPDFPAALEAIIMQLLEKNPERRFQSATDVATQMTDFLAVQPEPAHSRRRGSRIWFYTLVPLAAAIVLIGTILTFQTPKGTLVVDVEDPAIKVALDGEELTITGAGLHEVRLKPGSYYVTATKDGKPAKVSPEIVKIEKGGKQAVKVTFEPSGLPSPVPYQGKKAKTNAPDADALLEERMKSVLKDPEPTQLDLMRLALKASRSKATIGLVQGEPPNPMTHGLFPHLQGLVVEAASVDTTPDRIRTDLENAYLLAGKILSDTARLATKDKSQGSTTIPPDKRNEGPEDRQKKLVNEYQSLVARLAKTPPGRFLLTTSPGSDPDKAVAGYGGDEKVEARRLMVLRDEFAILVAKAQKELDRWERAQLDFADREAKHNAGLISGNEYDTAKLEVKQAERALKSAEDEMSRVIANVKKLADELHAPAADAPDPDPLEAEVKKLMAEYDALALRLAKTQVGRLLATVPASRDFPDSEDIRSAALTDEKKSSQARLLLKLRGQISAQALMAQTSLNERNNRRESKQKAKKEELIPNIDEEIGKNEQDVRVRTAAIRSLVEDFRKLADEIDPKPSPPEEAEAELRKVMAEYDALNLRLVNTPIGRVLALTEFDAIPDGDLKGIPEASWQTARQLLVLRGRIQKQKVEADKHRELLRPQPGRGPGLAGDAGDVQGLKFRTGALRGLVDDLKKLADEIDPPAKKDVPPTKKGDQ